jgi:hypothetical protein
MAFQKPIKESLSLRIYIGATPRNPINGLYSFSPAKVLGGSNNPAFPRIFLQSSMFSIPFTNNLNSAPKITGNCTLTKIQKAWQAIRNATRSAGLVPGFGFQYGHHNPLPVSS